ncbi:phage major tail tube protein [Maritimibacter sp. HL-12]|uniref:phage major tail tube protein n=1 Tax=Maritimibacter sp. HL-12 TaxID=1162418 RepID=UPI000A0F1C4A|nr:phage major tail tube protein [Maritimibacter sp. HL-12]SMH35808.1 hypothetical protein SAMN05661107_0645 [Maritimibacter sp. HL-12]
MAYPRKIRNFNAFVDGVSYFGRLTEGTLPQVKIQTEAHRGAGQDGPVGIDMGTEGMTADLTFAEWPVDVMKMLGTVQRFVFRPAAASAEGGGDADTIIATVSGLITAPEVGTLKPGEGSNLKLAMDVRYYRLEINGDEIWEIDLAAGIRKVGGVDQLAEIRRAMGI